VARILFIVLVVLLTFSATVAFAKEPWRYLGLNAGASGSLRDSENVTSQGSFNLGYDVGPQGSLVLGYRLPPNSELGRGRVEFEIGYRKNGIDQIAFTDGTFAAGGEAIVWNAMLNTFGEVATDSLWTPYLGGGIGVALVSLDSVTVSKTLVLDDTDLVFAYQIGAGVDYSISENLSFDLAYRFFATTNPNFKDVNDVDIESEYVFSTLQLGLRYMF